MAEPAFTKLLLPLTISLGVKSVALQESISFAVGFSLLTFLHITVGELAPKWLTIQRPLPIALWTASPLQWFYIAFYPFNRLLNFTARWLLKQTGIEMNGAMDHTHSEEELRLLLASAQGSAGGRNMVLNALDLRHRVAREIMRPRQEIAAFNTDASFADCLALAEQTRYSRFPLCEGGNLDKTRGVVHIKDLYTLRNQAQTAADLLPVARKLIYVPETARVEKLLQLFLEQNLHFAIVVDEYGGTLGIATLENVMEALVGQIQDEFDQEKSELVRVGENVWEAAGALPLHELEQIIGETQHGEMVATASGWMTQKLGGFPKVGDVLTFGACELRVEEMHGPLVGASENHQTRRAGYFRHIGCPPSRRTSRWMNFTPDRRAALQDCGCHHRPPRMAKVAARTAITPSSATAGHNPREADATPKSKIAPSQTASG